MQSFPPLPLPGHCQCGAVAYQIDQTPLQLNICHCTDCQKQSGSAFGMSLVIKPESFRLIKGRLQEFQVNTDSGREKTCAFCPGCGVRIFNRSQALMSVKAGTLDDTSWLAPDGHYWTRSKQGWTTLPEHTPCFETVPGD